MGEIIEKEKQRVTLDTPLVEVEQQLLAENNIDELNNIINIFNLNIKKKDMVRTSKLNDLQDKITNQMQERLDKHAGEFSNKDLLDYFRVLQDTISKSDNSLNSIDTPSIQINQQQINVGIEGTELNRASRDKVKNFISNLLKNSELENIADINNMEIIDVEPVSDNKEE